MKLAVFTNRFPGKVCTFFSRDMRALIEAGIEIDVFPIYPHEAHYWRYVPDILNEHVLPRNRVHHFTPRQVWTGAAELIRSARGARFLRDSAVIAAQSLASGPAPLAKSLYVMPLAWAWARHFAHDYDHILGYWGNYAATCAYLAHRLSGRPIPYSLYLHAGADLFLNQIFLREKLLYADRIVTECEYNRGFMREHFPDIFDRIAPKIQVNLMGMDLEKFPFSLNHRDARRVVAVGRLHHAKGYDFLLRAVAELRRRGVDLELELVGDGEERAALMSLAAQLGITDRVLFRGWVVFDEVRQAMSRGSVFVHPSSDVGDAKPNVIQEAIALGIPVVASSVAGIPELLDYGRCGVLVPPRDVQRLADAIAGLLGDPVRRVQLAEHGRRHAEATLDLWRNGRRLADHLRSARRPDASVPGSNGTSSPLC